MSLATETLLSPAALDAAELLGAEAADYEKVTDILDVWFDSGVTHEGVLLARGFGKPADLYLEGSDQHRGWFQSSLLTGVAIDRHAPYKQCLTHGFTVDEHGRKMSKSLGNGIEPQDIMKTLGADILRLWIASADYSNEMSLSQEILKRNADAYRRLRNTARFLLSNLNGFDPARDLVAPADMVALDRWIVHRAFELQEKIKAAYDRYDFAEIVQARVDMSQRHDRVGSARQAAHVGIDRGICTDRPVGALRRASSASRAPRMAGAPKAKGIPNISPHSC